MQNQGREHYRKKSLLSAISAAAFLLLLCLSFSNQLMAEPILIHNPNLKNENITPRSLTRIYSMQKKVWSNGQEVKVFMLPKNTKTHKTFVQRYLRMQPHQLDRLWHRLLFSGTGTIPQTVNSMEEMLEKVRETPGAIGYVDSSLRASIDNSMTQEAAKHE